MADDLQGIHNTFNKKEDGPKATLVLPNGPYFLCDCEWDVLERVVCGDSTPEENRVLDFIEYRDDGDYVIRCWYFEHAKTIQMPHNKPASKILKADVFGAVVFTKWKKGEKGNAKFRDCKMKEIVLSDDFPDAGLLVPRGAKIEEIE